MRTLSLADLAFLANLSGGHAIENFESYANVDPVVASALADGTRWDGATVINFSYDGLQAFENFEAYANQDPVTDALSAGLGWDSDGTANRAYIGFQARENFENYADVDPLASALNNGAGWVQESILVGVMAGPTISPGYSAVPTTVTLTPPAGFSGASLYYTTDGSTPTTSSTLYTGSFSVTTDPTTVRAIAVFSGFATAESSAIFFNTFPISGVKLWLKADALSLNDGDAVGSWTDSSGNSNTATQGTAANKPTFKTNILNSLPVVRFDATNDALTSPLSLANPFTIFAVYSYRGATSGFHRGISGGNNWLVGPYSGNHKQYSGAFITGPAVVQNAFVQTTSRQTNVLSEFRVNRTAIGSNGSTTAIGVVNLGAAGAFSEPLDGDVAELICFDVALSDADRTTVEGYLRGKYNL